MKKKIIKSILLLVMILLATAPLSVADKKPKKPKKPKKAEEINTLLEYQDTANGHYPDNTVIEGVAYTIYDGLNQVIVSGITDATGMITFIVLENYNQDGKGIHIEFIWQGVLISLNNLVVGGALHIEELNPFNLSPTFLWEDMSELPEGTVVDFYFEGVYFDSAIINSNGQLDIVQVIAGIYTLNSTFFSGLEMVVLVDHPSLQKAETFIISAQFILVSSIIAGVFYFFNILL